MKKTDTLEVITVCGDRELCLSLLRYCREETSRNYRAEFVSIYSTEDIIAEAQSLGILPETVHTYSSFSSEDIAGEVKSRRRSVLLLDSDMPGLDGLSVAEELKEAGLSANVILLSWFYSPLQRKIISSLGIGYCFTKPVDIFTLYRRVTDCGEMLSADSEFYDLPTDADCFVEDCRTGCIEWKSGFDLYEQKKYKATCLLHEIGVPANLCGHDYIRDAIMMSLEMGEIYGKMTKVIYPSIAEKYNKSARSVEKAIRTALETAWIRGKVELLNDIFGFTVNIHKGKPTNSEFIALLADKLKFQV